MTDQNASPFFMAFIQQQEFVGLLGLGKLADPTTGKAEVDLDKTRYAIGMLEMMEQKSSGNLAEAESRQLRHTLTSLRLNFVEEAQRAEATDGSPSGPPATEGESGSKAAEAPGGGE